MSLKQRLATIFLSAALASGLLSASAQTSAAGGLSKAEAAAIAGIGGFIIGAAVARASRGPDYHGDHRSAWERHVDRCYARYRSYDEATDTYVGFDGNLYYCRSELPSPVERR